MFGNLTLAAFPHDPIVLAAGVFMGFVALGVLFALWYFKRWHWLFTEWITSVNHKRIGVMYLIVSLTMLIRGAMDAAMMRGQQAISVGSSHGYLTADHFQQVATAHGVIMIFFAAMGLMFGLINLIVPLQIGSRDVAFPRLNSLSFWLYVMGAALVNLALVVGGGFAATGWLAYPPLSELHFSPGVGMDYYIWSLQIAGIGSLLSGINFVVTITKLRAPGMNLMKMPIFVWTVLCSMVLVILAFPILTATLAMLSLDRILGMHFFTAGFGGNAMMYINLIWAWGHPEVYILALPAFGVFSEVVPVFSQKKLFGYKSMVYATIAITILSFIVWLHHFFTMGAGGDVNAFFGIMTMIIAIPTGVKIFNWLFTMFRGSIRFTTPMLWFLGFVTTFTLGGVAGVLLAMPAADFQLHNSLFLVAHFHTMIVGGVVFGYFAGITYWFPKVFGFRLNEKLGTYAFWCWLVGFLLAFVPLYILGMMGATRRLDHYSSATGWQSLFIVAGIGVIVIGLGVIFQAMQLIVSIRQRKQNLDKTGDPWNGRTLEWSIASPAPIYNFAHIPHVHSIDAFWAEKEGKQPHTKKHYEAIAIPKNTYMGITIAALSFMTGFALIWHIFWLAALGILAIIIAVIFFANQEELEYMMPAEEVAKIEHTYART